MPRKAKEEKKDLEVKTASKVAPKVTKNTEKKASTKVSSTTTKRLQQKRLPQKRLVQNQLKILILSKK